MPGVFLVRYSKCPASNSWHNVGMCGPYSMVFSETEYSTAGAMRLIESEPMKLEKTESGAGLGVRERMVFVVGCAEMKPCIADVFPHDMLFSTHYAGYPKKTAVSQRFNWMLAKKRGGIFS